MKRLFIVLLALLLISPAMALRCGNKLVIEGDSRVKVKHRCGEPVDVLSYRDYAVHYNPYGHYGQESWDLIEQWTYNFGPQKFLYILTFRNGRLESIETDNYGY